MYKVEMNISDWGNDETITIETGDFDKVQIIQEFIEFQKENGWAADYELVTTDDEEVDGIDAELEEEDEPTTVSTYLITKIEE